MNTKDTTTLFLTDPVNRAPSAKSSHVETIHGRPSNCSQRGNLRVLGSDFGLLARLAMAKRFDTAGRSHPKCVCAAGIHRFAYREIVLTS